MSKSEKICKGFLTVIDIGQLLIELVYMGFNKAQVKKKRILFFGDRFQRSFVLPLQQLLKRLIKQHGVPTHITLR